MFPDDTAKLKAGRISNEEREIILTELGLVAQAKYDEFVVQGGQAKGYNLYKLQGSLSFRPNIQTFENEYWLEGRDSEWTKIAEYFEYGTGLHNQRRAGKYRAGYIKPKVQKYLQFVAKDGNFVSTKRVAGVKPIFAMTKAVKFVEFNRDRLQRDIRLRLAQ